MQKIVDSWKDSSKNLWKLVDSGMSSTSKVGLGYEIKSNDEGPQKPEISDSDDTSNEHSTCQSNDSEGSFGNPSEHSSESESESISVPNEMSTSKSVTTNEKDVSESKEVEPSCVTHIKTPRQQMKNQETHKVKGKNWNEMMERELGEGYSFIKKKCFVCGSLSHLIRDCDFYEKKMAREAELKKQRVFNTGNGVAKPVWNNANRVNRANHFIPRPVQLNTVRQNVNSVRPNVNTGRANVNSVKSNVNSVRSNVNSVRANANSVRENVNSVRQNVNSVRFSPVRPQVNKFNQRSNFSKSHSPVSRPIVRNTTKMSYTHAVKGNWGTAVKTSAEEQGELSIEERLKLFVELMDKRKKHFAKLRAEEIKRKPPTKAQKRNQMCTYLKNMARYKHSQLKNKTFEEIHMLFDNTMKWVDLFVPMDSEVVEGSKSQAEGSNKRIRKELDEENVKRQKLEDNAEKAELKSCLEIVLGDVVTIESLATKYPIGDWKTHILAVDNMYYQIVKADGSAKFYKIFSAVLDDFDRQDVLDLYRLVKERFETTSPEGYDRLL
ncbi:putative ribonuclease H-like domain-containing protein [Tanacetum coccineum]